MRKMAIGRADRHLHRMIDTGSACAAGENFNDAIVHFCPESRLRWRRLCLMLGIALTLGRISAAAPIDSGWASILNNEPKQVLRVPDDAAAPRETRLARGAAWMSLQPATDENMRKAEEIFDELAGGDDGIAAEAAYLRARLVQLHFLQPDYEEAARRFEELARRQPESHWAQLGLVKLGLMKLYVLHDGAVPDSDRLQSTEALLKRIHEPVLRRDLHLQIGQAGVVLKQPLPRIIPHLVAADAVGGITGTAREDLVVQIGELSLRAGLLEQSKSYFERYLRDYPESLRTYAVQRRLEETHRRLAQQSGGSQ